MEFPVRVLTVVRSFNAYIVASTVRGQEREKKDEEA